MGGCVRDVSCPVSHAQGGRYADGSWQRGYGTFSISRGTLRLLRASMEDALLANIF